MGRPVQCIRGFRWRRSRLTRPLQFLCRLCLRARRRRSVSWVAPLSISPRSPDPSIVGLWYLSQQQLKAPPRRLRLPLHQRLPVLRRLLCQLLLVSAHLSRRSTSRLCPLARRPHRRVFRMWFYRCIRLRSQGRVLCALPLLHQRMFSVHRSRRSTSRLCPLARRPHRRVFRMWFYLSILLRSQGLAFRVLPLLSQRMFRALSVTPPSGRTPILSCRFPLRWVLLSPIRALPPPRLFFTQCGPRCLPVQ